MSTTTIDSPKSNQRMTLRYNGSPTRPTLKAHGSTLSLASPTKLNVVHSDWEPSKGGHIPLLKRNSSNLSQPTTDRFIPSRFTVSNGRVSKDETLPPPNASPIHNILKLNHKSFIRNQLQMLVVLKLVKSITISTHYHHNLILDAPGLIDDFYLNPISWSCDNYFAIALDNGLYVWNASSGSVHLLTECDFTISSVRWSERWFIFINW
ncbi:APC/C activator protein CDC20 [Cyberlindnera fabianii]|uniref:APC/C activator protein CDC20 n=1 Tax=Cyberlindnera fabianii TaxID=36022 RepID=A0A1V2LAN2_CYBFA|nr:APC/C activator protein CDC20 [Cyberlindnera fabianii]